MMVIILSVLIGLATAGLLFKLFFDDLEEFGECFMYLLKPNILSLFDGDYLEDQWKSMKLGFWAALSIGAGVGTYFSLMKHFG
ncbi:MAG: hypothetical protein R3C01_08180 [Planctomycetaceae bacterium]